MEHFFPPNSSGHLRSDAHQRLIIGGDADVDHTQTIGVDTVKLLGWYIPPGFRHLWGEVRYVALSNIFAINNNPLEDFPEEIFDLSWN